MLEICYIFAKKLQDKKSMIRVFISSVQAEFADERRLLCDYIRQDALLGRFFSPFIFEELPAINLSAPEADVTPDVTPRTIHRDFKMRVP